jgi:release factor glutamine methyltransferase
MIDIIQKLRAAGIGNAAQEAKWITEYGERNNGSSLDIIINRRCNGEPLQYLLGEWEFYGYPFKVGKGVLIPRPETELLVDLAAEWSKLHTKPTILDLCAGTGCVGIALAREIGCEVTAVEKSAEAIEYLKYNISLNGVRDSVRVIRGDVLKPSGLPESDCILINAPYLSKSEMLELQKEVSYEPEAALFGGGDGLDFYRGFFAGWSDSLKRASLLACEVGDGQAEEVCRILYDMKLNPKIKQDYNKINRIVYVKGKTNG